jgi:hypothetical protein
LAYRAQNPAPVMAVPEAGFGNGTERSGAMHKHQQFSKFEKYVKSRDRKVKRALSEIETRGAAAALDKCRVLAEQIDGDLRNKKRRHLFNNIALLAEFQVSIERAASLLNSIATLNYDQQEDTENREKFARNAA